MTASYVQIHLSDLDREIRVAWYPSKKIDPYGVIDFGNVKLYLSSGQLDALEQAVSALQRERDGQEG